MRSELLAITLEEVKVHEAQFRDANYLEVTMNERTVARLAKIVAKPAFQEKLRFGKYSQWAQGLSAETLLAIFKNIDRLSSWDPDNLSIDEDRHLILRRLVMAIRGRKGGPKNLLRPNGAPNGAWADKVTESDLFGIIWHIEGFSCRYSSQLEPVEELHPRCLESLDALIRVARGESTSYRVGGNIRSIGEHS